MSTSSSQHDLTAPVPAHPHSTQDGLRRAAPTALVITVLCGLAVWGHSTDWAMPRFSALIGSGQPAVDDWCTDHNVPGPQCIECRPTLVPHVNHGWCKEHGIAQCPLHHPELAQLKEVRNVTTADFDRAQTALAVLPRSENNSRCQLHTRRIQFASSAAVEKAGVDIAVVQERPILETVSANGEVVYDQGKIAHLSSRVEGSVWRVNKQVGDRVRAGEILAFVDGVEIGRSKNEFLQAVAQLRLKQKTLDQLKPLAKDGAIPGKQFLEADVALQEAQIRLQGTQQALVNLGLSVQADDFAEMSAETIAKRIQYLGIPAETTDAWDRQTTTSNLFPLRSPLDGVVVEREVVAGEVVDTTRSLFTVADVAHLWLMLDVRHEDAKYVSLGQPVLFKPNGRDESEIEGVVSWLSTSADVETRTVKVRVVVPNADGRLRANTFGTGRIVLREEPQGISVPTEAVHWDGCCNVVFVRDKNYMKKDAFKFFHVRKVRLGVKDAGVTEIIAGVLPGEVIASKNSVVLEAQLLKSNLGAGCCEACAPKK